MLSMSEHATSQLSQHLARQISSKKRVAGVIANEPSTMPITLPVRYRIYFSMGRQFLVYLYTGI